ncbi:MAG: N-acetylgalactosamine-6-sulfatase, partial [Calditrichaeota bacterium]
MKRTDKTSKKFMTKALLGGLGLLFLLNFYSCSSNSAQTPQNIKPNLIIILTDDQGWGDVSFNGSTDLPTPHLDGLAESGVIFTQGYASHPYCSPSRAGLLTGRYQQRFGHENNLPYDLKFENEEIGLPLSETPISNTLKENGYKTAAIGKWHLGMNPLYWPTARGFDEWYGFYGGGHNYWGTIKKGKAEHSGVLRNGKPVPVSEQSYLTDDFTKETVKFIRENKDQPFFVYLAYNAPHGPFQASRKYLDKTDYIEDGARAVNAAMVKAIDDGVGLIKQELEQQGLLNNTVIVFFSDNGGHGHGSDQGPYRGKKGMLFEGGIRVPFFISWPEGIPAGKIYENPITGLDVFPTLLAAAGIDQLESIELDGKNLLPYIKGENVKSPHDALFWRYSGGNGYAVRNGKYKLIKEEVRDDMFLFNMENDPYEMHNLYTRKPEEVARLQALYD